MMAITLGASPSAQADTDVVQRCDRQGAQAERLARERDRGVTPQAAVDAVLAQDASADRTWLMQAAELLFQRFQRMRAEQVALEFAAACLDDAQ